MDVLDLGEISRAVQARHLATPMGSALVLNPGDDADSALERLRLLQFDAAPVAVDGRPTGIFRAGPQRGRTVGHRMAPLAATVMVSADTPMADVARFLCEEPFLFVLRGREITGFITPADLGSAAARTHYYLLLAALEMALARLLRRSFPHQMDAIALLSPQRRKAHHRLTAQLRERDELIDDIAALSLADLLAIAGSDSAYRSAATSAGRGWRWLGDGLANFRNDVMHPARDFAAASASGIGKLVDFEERMSTLIAAAEEVTNGSADDMP